MSKTTGVTLLISFLLGALPFLLFGLQGGIPKLPIEIADDTIYYLSRAREVFDGHITTANQYLKEHQDSITPAFFVGDWFASIPFFLGFDARGVQIFNQILWFLVCGYLLHLCFRMYGVRERVIPFAVVAVLLSVYWYEARPTVMQVVYPMCLLFYIALWNFLKRGSQKRFQIYFALVIAGSLYMYTYLALCVLCITGVLFLLKIYKRDFLGVKHIVLSVVGAGMLCIPFFLYTLKQIQHPFYTQSFERIGMVSTYLIGGGALYYVVILLIMSVSFWFSYKNDVINKHQYTYFFVITSGLALALVSNVLTGKEFELSSHIGRFIDIWLVMYGFMLAWSLYIRKPTKKIYWIIGGTLSVMVLFVVQIEYVSLNKWKSVSPQLSQDRFLPVLEYINKNIPPESVIFADDNIGSYIPLITSHYVLFHPNAQLYLVSNEEIEERYLLSRVFGELTLDDIKNDFRKYAGVGNAIHKARVYNREILLCNMLRGKGGDVCNMFTTPIRLQGEDYFVGMLKRYLSIKKNVNAELASYNVEYIIVDMSNEAWVIPSDFTRIWTSTYFTVYEVPKN